MQFLPLTEVPIRAFLIRGALCTIIFLPIECTLDLFLCLRLSKHTPIILLSCLTLLEKKEDWQTRSLILVYNLHHKNSAGNMRLSPDNRPFMGPSLKLA